MIVDTIYSEAMEIADRSNKSILDNLLGYLLNRDSKPKIDPVVVNSFGGQLELIKTNKQHQKEAKSLNGELECACEYCETLRSYIFAKLKFHHCRKKEDRGDFPPSDYGCTYWSSRIVSYRYKLDKLENSPS